MKLIRNAQVRIPAATEESEENAERAGLVQNLRSSLQLALHMYLGRNNFNYHFKLKNISSVSNIHFDQSETFYLHQE